MGPNNYDTKNGKYKQLKESERWKIEAYLKVGLKSVEIAEKMGRNRSTITREIKRGKVKQKRSDLTEKEGHLSTMLCFRIKKFNIE
ncbi:MAG: helix-turn-helix domain-containing protein [Candidatus Goldbacteria bacterium]|nr:helix-turn-helix domain-containing protein [Candidatus Goldiibacteriota bacterium]